jgi:hypothetical protein
MILSANQEIPFDTLSTEVYLVICRNRRLENIDRIQLGAYITPPLEDHELLRSL